MKVNGSLYLPLLLILPLGLAGCARSKVGDAYLAKHAAVEPLTREVAVDPLSAGPYHFAVRLGPDAVAQLVEETVVTKLANTNITIKPEMADKIEMPSLGLTGLTVDFPTDSQGVLRARVKLEGRVGIHVREVLELVQAKVMEAEPQAKGKGKSKGKKGGFVAPGGLADVLGLGSGERAALIADEIKNRAAGAGEVRWISLHPELSVRVGMSTVLKDGRPALKIDLLQAEDFNLGLGESLDYPLVENLVQEIARQKVTEQLLSQAGEGQFLALPENLGKGDIKLAVKAAGVTIVPGTKGELFLGFVTDLAAKPQVLPPSRGGSLGEHSFAISLGDDMLSLVLRNMAQQGRIPLHFDKRGNPDPEGKVVVDLDSIHLTDAGFEMATRIWNLGFPAFWQNYTMMGHFAFEEGQLRPQIDSMKAGDGDGNTWLGRKVGAKAQDNPKMGLSSASRKAPPALPLPMSGGKRVMQLNLKDVATEEGLLIILGDVTLKDAPMAR